MNRAQSSLTYLVLIGAAVLVAAVVVSTLINISIPVGDETVNDTVKLFCSRKVVDTTAIPAVDMCTGETVVVKGLTYTCAPDGTGKKCVWDGNPGA